MSPYGQPNSINDQEKQSKGVEIEHKLERRVTILAHPS
jgi:hypothetical protein